MPRKRSLPVLLVLLVLLGADALWSLHSSLAATIPEPIVVHHQRIGAEEVYSGSLLLPACAELRSGIGEEGSPAQVRIDLSVERATGPCDSDPKTFSLSYAGEPGAFGGVTIAGTPAAYQLVEDR